tara:strand:- start:6384 stop:6668 length:285 start_codon:yes stop_codon:yes gene_type:complete
MAEDTRIIYFSAEWCGPCKSFKPIIEKLEKAGYPIYFQDIDNDPILAESYQIRSVPTIKILQNDKVQETLVGVQDPTKLLAIFDMYYPLQTDES